MVVYRTDCPADGLLLDHLTHFQALFECELLGVVQDFRLEFPGQNDCSSVYRPGKATPACFIAACFDQIPLETID